MKNKRQKIVSVLYAVILLLALLTLTFPSALAITSTITSDNADYGEYQTRQNMMCVDSSGVLYHIHKNTSNAIILEVSNDDGSTWSSLTVNDSGHQPVIAIDSNDVLHVVYQWSNGIRYRKSSNGGSSWSDSLKLDDVLSHRGNAITVDANDGIVVAWQRYVGPAYYRVSAIAYTVGTDTWSSTITVIGGTDTVPQCMNLVSTNNGLVYMVSAHAFYYFDSGSWTSMGDIFDFELTSSSAVAYGNTIHAFASSAAGSYNIRYSYYDGSSWSSSEVIYDNSYILSEVVASCTAGGIPTVMFKGKTWETANYQILSMTKTGGSWDAAYVQTTGNTDKEYPVLLYQNLPSFCKLFDGFCGSYLNESDAIIYFDSGSLNWYTQGSYVEGDVPSCCLSCDTIGTFDTGGDSLKEYDGDDYNTFMFTKHNVKETGLLKSVDLAIHEDMANELLNDEYADMNFKVNEYALGSYDSLVQLGDSDRWVVSWECNLTLDNTRLYMIWHVFRVDNWKVFVTLDDINVDGFREIGWFDSTISSSWNNFHTLYDTFRIEQAKYRTIGNDLQLRLCIDRSDYSDTHDYPNDVFVNVDTGCTNKTYDITWFLNNTALLDNDKYITVDLAGVVKKNKTIDVESGHFGFTPTEQGTYTINLSVNGNVLATDTLTINCDTMNYIYTDPNPSLIGQSFRIYYGYTYTSYNARIKVKSFTNEWVVQRNTSGFVTFSISTEGLYTIVLEQYNNDTNKYIFVTDNSDCKHSVESHQGEGNLIDVSTKTLVLGESLNIFGYHAHGSGEVYAKFGNTLIKNLADNTEFNFLYTPTKSGTFLVSLVLKKPDGSEIELDNAGSVTVSSTSGPSEPSDDDTTISLVPDDFKPYVAALIIFMSLIVPVGIAANNMIDLPVIVYVISPLISTCLCVGIGLIEIYWILAIAIGLFAYIAYMLLNR